MSESPLSGDALLRVEIAKDILCARVSTDDCIDPVFASQHAMYSLCCADSLIQFAKEKDSYHLDFEKKGKDKLKIYNVE